MTKILVIEDEWEIRQNIIEFLEAEEFTALEAENGLVGLQLATEQLPDLILCDVMMPEIDGFYVLDLLRKNAATASIPFIFLTAKASMSDLRTGMELGADDYLTKPFFPEELLKAIKTRLARHHAIQQNQETVPTPVDMHWNSVTQLPNRLSLRDRFTEFLIQQSYQHNRNDLLIPVFCIGIDRFSRINDTLGYEMGDRLLQSVSKQLKNALSSNTLIAHLNADEFAIIFPPIERQRDAGHLADTLKSQLSYPFTLNQQEIFLTVSIGIALYYRDGTAIEQLLQRAKKALSHAKKNGGDEIAFYSGALTLKSARHLSLETELRYAIERKQLQVFYQPQIQLQASPNGTLPNQSIIGAEALVRWPHPTQGQISPGEFIPLAEQTGLIEPLGDWVLWQACKQLRTWHKAGYTHLSMAINISARQFNRQPFSPKIQDILRVTQLPPNRLELELTEGTLVQNVPQAMEQMHRLKNLGVQLAIDDFGTGYSSLSYLQQFPFDILKIDRAFVRNLTTHPQNQTILRAIVTIAQGLNLTVVAEGVETTEELAFFQQQQENVTTHHTLETRIQGYLYSPAVPASEFTSLLQRYPLLIT
ncbi:MAG: EAL domain-containing protein [Kamptonema sp. SIO4C4]|nr:EAL domain-containing protein [Kamptonema sp. SIO4C4]